MGFFSFLGSLFHKKVKPVGNDRALFVGINKYPGCPLAGCIDDIIDTQAKLKTMGSWDMHVLQDGNATTRNWLDALRWLAATPPGGRKFFHYSGHGAQVESPLESDGYLEVVCPVDFDWSPERMITDKQFVEIFSTMPRGGVFNWLSDSCLAGATKIPLLDGTEKTIEEMCREAGTYWVYSAKENGEVTPGKAHSARVTGHKKLFCIKLDNDQTFECTADHRVMLRDGSYREAGQLKPGDSLMPLYRKVTTAEDNENKKYLTGYEQVLTTSKFGNRIWVPTHLVVRDAAGMKLPGSKKTICHHKNFNKRDNRPDNLEMMTWYDHQRCHGKVGAKNFEKVWANPEFRAWRRSEEYRKAQSERTKRSWADPVHRAKRVEINRKRFEREGLPENFKAYNFSKANSENTKRRLLPGGDLHTKLRTPEATAKLVAAITAPCHRAKMMLGIRMHKTYRDVLKLNSMTKEQFSFEEFKQLDSVLVNHKVISVEDTGRVEAVYDLTVDEHHNFAVSAGVFVHNCHSGDLLREIPHADGRVKIPRSMPRPAHIHAAMKTRTRRVLPREVALAPYDVGFISGCQSDQTSADTQVNGRPCGAATHYFLQELNLSPNLPLLALVCNMSAALMKDGYDQRPQAEGSRIDKPFLG